MVESRKRICTDLYRFLGADQYHFHDSFGPYQDYLLSNEKVKGGAQAKEPDSGFAIHKKNKTKHHIKSAKHKADNYAGLVTSHLQAALFGTDITTTYEVITNRANKMAYIVSEVRPNSKKVSELNINYKDLLHWGKTSVPGESTKQKIYDICFKGNSQLIKDQCRRLVADIITCNDDGQVDNLILYTDLQGKQRIAGFDFDWGLAGILKDKHAVVNLFAKKNIWGSKATHVHEGLPANHFLDFLPLINNHPDEFFEAVDDAIINLQKLLNSVAGTVNKITEKVADAFKQKELELFAEHVHYTGPRGKNVEEFKSNMIVALKKRLEERTYSLELAKTLLQINLINETIKRSHKKNIPAALGEKMGAAIGELNRIVKNNFAGQKIVNFMPSLGKISVDSALANLLTNADRFMKKANLSGAELKKHHFDNSSLLFIKNLRKNLGNKQFEIEKPKERTFMQRRRALDKIIPAPLKVLLDKKELGKPAGKQSYSKELDKKSQEKLMRAKAWKTLSLSYAAKLEAEDAVESELRQKIHSEKQVRIGKQVQKEKQATSRTSSDYGTWSPKSFPSTDPIPALNALRALHEQRKKDEVRKLEVEQLSANKRRIGVGAAPAA